MCIHFSKTIPFLPYCMCKLNGFCTEVFFVMYSKTCLKRPLYNRQNKDLNDKWQLNEGQKYCRMLPFEHSAILWPALSDNRSSKNVFWSFRERPFRQGLLHVLHLHVGLHFNVTFKVFKQVYTFYWRASFLFLSTHVAKPFSHSSEWRACLLFLRMWSVV